MLSQENIEQNKKGRSKPGKGYSLTDLYSPVSKHFFLIGCDAETPTKTY
jgi:hypothetical protein